MKMVVYIIEKACPLCKGDVKGNEEFKYFCKHCNMLFEKKYLSRQEEKELPPEEEKEVIKAESGPEVEVFSEDTEPLEETEELNFVASAKSNKMHLDTCHFLKKIHKDNWIYLKSLEEGIEKEYEPCVCIRRKGLMKQS